MPVMCPPSLTKLCRYLFIKEIVRFPAGSGRLLFTAAEQQPENGTAQRAAVQHLPAQGHGHVAAPGVHPHAKAGLFEQDGCHQAHDRAHDGDDHQGDGIAQFQASCKRLRKGSPILPKTIPLKTISFVESCKGGETRLKKLCRTKMNGIDLNML